jgi:CheY-like chemotaxis protein
VKQALRVLVVDDESSVRRSIKLMLEYDGHEVWLAEGGEAALEQLAQRKFDLVITDFLMPEMHGDQLIASIRKLIPSQRIIIDTAFVEEYKIYGQASGADALLFKPFSFKDLREAIEQALTLKQPVQTGELAPGIGSKSTSALIPPRT